MRELSALAGSEGYEVYADDAQGVQPLERSSATQKKKRSGVSSFSAGRTYEPAEADPYKSAPLGIWTLYVVRGIIPLVGVSDKI